METVIHRASERGNGDHGWLSSRFSFSFANWHDPARMGFGALRVLNDDTIAPSSGFGMHGHKDMEIVTIVMKGAVTHEDSMGNHGTVSSGDVQVMSAGTGVVHSERNLSTTESLELFQLWITPEDAGGAPRYQQKSFEETDELLVSPDGRSGSLAIQQRSYITRITLETGSSHLYAVHEETNGVYIFVVRGEVTVGGVTLSQRDAIGISGDGRVEVLGLQDSTVLLIEIPNTAE